MAAVYEDMISLIPNATMRKMHINGVFRTYNITPIDGYVLHDADRDFYATETITDENGNEIEIEVFKLGYHPMTVSCGYMYQFTPVEMLDEAGNTVTAYGDRKFYCKLASDVPADQIFGVVEQPEVM